MKCLLIEEIKGQDIPPNLKVIISSLESPSNSDYVVVALYTLMIEYGFIPLNAKVQPTASYTEGYGFDTRRLSSYHTLPIGWKEENPKSYQIKFQLGGFSEHRCRLILLLLGDVLIVDAIVDNTPLIDCGLSETLYSMTVCPANYVTCAESVDGPNFEYKNMKELAVKFKNLIASPAHATILNKYGIPNPSLLGLPDEILLKVLRYLKIGEIATVMCVCQHLKDLSEDNLLWQYLFKRDGMKTPSDGGEREINYKTKYSKALAWNKKSTPPPALNITHQTPIRYARF